MADDLAILQVIEQVIHGLKDNGEDAPEVIQRLTGIDREVMSMFVAHTLEVSTEPVELYANLIAVGAILAIDHWHRTRVVSIERAKRALPDETTLAQDDASKGGQ